MKHRRRHLLLRSVTMLLLFPLASVSAAYALFTQDLTLDTAVSSVAYVSNNYTRMTYVSSSTFAANKYTYTINPMTITNTGATSITAWNVTVTLPTDVTSATCPSSIVCSYNTTTKVLTITNGTGNGTIAASGNRVINNATTPIRFTTATAGYVLQNVNISATYSTTYQAVAGLTVVATAGARSGGNYPLTVVITNNSGQTISGWQVRVPVTRTCTSTVPAGITYTCTSTLLTYTGAAVAIANGAQYQFTTTVTYNRATWVTSGATVLGRA
jgi:hypothetical protein